MPNKHFYFAMGAMTGTALVTLYHKRRHKLRSRWQIIRHLDRMDRDWFLYFPFFIGAWGCIALIPDLLLFLGLMSKPEVRGPLFDIFFLYSTLERWEDIHPRLDHVLNILGEVMLFVIGTGVFAYYIRELTRLERTSRKRH